MVIKHQKAVSPFRRTIETTNKMVNQHKIPINYTMQIHNFMCNQNYSLFTLHSTLNNEKGPLTNVGKRALSSKKAATYSPALHCSTIGAGGLNFSVRNGKRWNPAAIATWIRLTHSTQAITIIPNNNSKNKRLRYKSLGQLVVLGFDVTVFTPAPYQRRGLRRPSGSPHLAAGFALRCFQRLSDPDSDTRRCTWRHNR